MDRKSGEFEPVNLPLLRALARDDDEMIDTIAFIALNGRMPRDAFKSEKRGVYSMLAKIALTVIMEEDIEAAILKRYERGFTDEK